MGKVSILIGLPRSGKSTYSKNWIKEFDTKPRVICRDDDIRLAMTNQRYNELVEDYIHAVKKTMIKTLFITGHHVLCDDTHSTWKSIKTLLLIDPFAELIFFPKRFSSYEELEENEKKCIKNAISTNQQDLIPIIGRMALNLKDLIFDNFDTKLRQYRESSIKHKPHIAN